MSGGGVATMTAVRIKQLSTSIFVKFARGFSRIEFLHRNRKAVALCLLIWVVVNVAGFFAYRNAVTRANNALFDQGLSAAQTLAAESGPFVLEKDILAMNVAIQELGKLSDLKFAAILDHENTILSHTDTQMINRKFEPPEGQKTIDTINDTAIMLQISPCKSEIMGFQRSIRFSNIEI